MIGAILSSTARTAARSTPEVASVGWAITRLIVAPFATAPDHSTSRSASVSGTGYQSGIRAIDNDIGNIRRQAKKISEIGHVLKIDIALPEDCDVLAGPVNCRRGCRPERQDVIDRREIVWAEKIAGKPRHRRLGHVYPGWTTLTRPVDLALEKTPPRWYAGCFGKLWREFTPSTTGASAAGICGSLALAQ